MNIFKITIVSVISLFLTVLPSQAKEIRIGAALAMTDVDAEGSEILKDAATKDTTEASATTNIPSLFLELSMDNGFGLGVEHVTGTADISSTTRSRADDDNQTSGGNKASAEIDGLTSVYLIKTFENGLFIKAGKTSTTVTTKEVLNTGSKYDNADIDGNLIGIGFSKTNDNGIFVRLSGEVTDYDTINLTSKTADAVTGTFNKVSADVDTMAMKISVGKAF